jgi:predicted GTPase
LTKQILINEDGRNNFDSKIKKEINLLKQEKNFLLIDYLTIMILGLTGVGKSTMVNFLLKLKKPDATEVNYWGIQTTEASIYKSDKVPFFHLIDTRGIELDQNYSITNVGIAADQFIYDQLKKNDINEVVHYIWYCIESIRFQKKEKNLVQNIMKTLNTINTYKKNNHILVIIVLTK